MDDIPIGQAGWAVIDKDGNIIDVYTYEVTRESLVMYDSERIIEVVITPVKT